MTELTNTENLFTETDVLFDVATLVSGVGNKFSLRFQLVELNIYDDIFANAITASLLLDDTYNMIEKLPLVGQELFYLRIAKPGMKDERDIPHSLEGLWRVHKIEKVIPANQRKQVYMVHLVGEDTVTNAKERVVKTYDGVKPEAGIKDILKDVFGYDDNQLDTFTFDDSASAYKCVIPNLHPYDAINYLASKARTPTGMSDFIFFENNDGYQFRSLSNIFADPDTAKLTFQDKNMVGAGEPDVVNPYAYLFSPISTEIRVLFDHLNSLRNGEFGVYSGTYDFAKQRYSELPIHYDIFLSKYKKLGSEKSFSANKFGKIPLNDYADIPVSTEEGNKHLNAVLHFDANPSISNESRITDYEGEQSATRMMQLASLSDQRIVMHYPGNPLLICGKMVKLVYPSIQGRTESGEPDEYLSARYLIVATRHRVTTTTWDTYIELTKDTLPNKIPDHSGANYDISALTSKKT